jgi:hypothetical protein
VASIPAATETIFIILQLAGVGLIFPFSVLRLLDRCHDVLEIVNIIVNFSVLETATIGGSKGKVLSTSVRQIHADFIAAQNAFRHTEYDLMDIDNKAFADDFFKFRSAVKEQERRLSSVLVQVSSGLVREGERERERWVQELETTLGAAPSSSS